MNKLLELADVIENQSIEGLGFSMEVYGEQILLGERKPWMSVDCKTAGCIAGHAVALWDRAYWKEYVCGGAINMSACAQELLGLDSLTAHELFIPHSDMIDYCKITPQIAAQVIRNLDETGDVVWPDEVYYD